MPNKSLSSPEIINLNNPEVEGRIHLLRIAKVTIHDERVASGQIQESNQDNIIQGNFGSQDSDQDYNNYRIPA